MIETLTNPISEMESEGNPNTDDLIKLLRGTVIVTGSSGLIGYKLCERLSETYNVVGFDRAGQPHPPLTVDRIDTDLTSDESVKQAFQTVRQRYGNKILSVIHLAAFYDFSGKPSSKYDEITVQGTARLLHFLKPFQVDQFIFCSTMLIYSPCLPGQRINENWPIAPKWDYPESKIKTENLIRKERGKMPVVFLRLSGVYDDDCRSIPIAHQIKRIYERALTSHFFPGDLSHGQSFLHLEDAINLISLLIVHRGRLSREEVFVAGEPTTYSYETLQQEIVKLIYGTSWTTKRVPKLLAKIVAWLQEHIPFIPKSFIKPWMIDLADDHFELDVSKARKLTGWEAEHSLIQTLPVIINSLKENPHEWYKKNKFKLPVGIKSEKINGKPHFSTQKKSPVLSPSERNQK